LPCRFLPLASLASAALLALPACGGDDDGEGTNIDSGSGSSGADSGTGAIDSGTVDSGVACPVAGTLGPFEPLPGAQAAHFTQDMDPAVRFLSVGAVVDGVQAPVDIFFVDLWDGFGAFENGMLAAGDFTIEEAETALGTCGVCVTVFGNFNGTAVEKIYIATSGTVSVQSAGVRDGNEITGNYTGSASNLVLVEVDQQSQVGGPLAGGCQTSIASATWDAVITNGDM
jgi:hypothetical protein